MLRFREKEQPERRIHSGARCDEKKPLGFVSLGLKEAK